MTTPTACSGKPLSAALLAMSSYSSSPGPIDSKRSSCSRAWSIRYAKKHEMQSATKKKYFCQLFFMSSRRPRIKDPERYKTMLCSKFASCGWCQYGRKCQFAHGTHELRRRKVSPSLVRSERSSQLGSSPQLVSLVVSSSGATIGFPAKFPPGLYADMSESSPGSFHNAPIFAPLDGVYQKVTCLPGYTNALCVISPKQQATSDPAFCIDCEESSPDQSMSSMFWDVRFEMNAQCCAEWLDTMCIEMIESVLSSKTHEDE